MFHKKRVFVTLAYLGILIITIIVAVKASASLRCPSRRGHTTVVSYVIVQTESIVGVIICIICQFCALVWCVTQLHFVAVSYVNVFVRRYTASYIPFARDIIWKALSGCFGRMGG
jgi:hypothetical protein